MRKWCPHRPVSESLNKLPPSVNSKYRIRHHHPTKQSYIQNRSATDRPIEARLGHRLWEGKKYQQRAVSKEAKGQREERHIAAAASPFRPAWLTGCTLRLSRPREPNHSLRTSMRANCYIIVIIRVSCPAASVQPNLPARQSRC